MNSIDWLIQKFSSVLDKTDFTNEQNFLLIKYIEQAREMYQDEIIAAYIAAKMERNKVKKHFAYFLKLDRVQIAAQEYYNQTYGDGVQ